jgi:MFS family permease
MTADHSPRADARFRFAVLGLATVAQTAASFATQGVGPLALSWQSAQGLSHVEVGLLLSAVNLVPLFVMMPIGAAIDRYGERWLVGVGTMLIAACLLMAAFSTRYVPLLLSLAAVGACYATSQPGGSKAIVTWFPPRERGLAMGIRQTGIPLGGALSAAILPLTVARFGLRSALVLQAAVTSLGGLLFAVFYREKAESHRAGGLSHALLPRLKEVMRRADHAVLFAGVALVSLQFVLVAHSMIYFVNVVHLSPALSGALLAVIQISGLIGRVALAWLSDRCFSGERLRPLSLCIWSSALGSLLLAFLPHAAPVWALGALCVWLGFFGVGWYSLFIVLVSESAPPDSVALTVSFALTLNQLAIVLSPPLFGLLVDWRGDYRRAWSLLSLLLVASAIAVTVRRSIALRSRPHTHREG